LEKFPGRRYDSCNTEVGMLEISFVDVNRIKMAKNHVNMTALVLEMTNLPVLQPKNSLAVYQCRYCVYHSRNHVYQCSVQCTSAVTVCTNHVTNSTNAVAMCTNHVTTCANAVYSVPRQ
jgi:hypothetical protein